MLLVPVVLLVGLFPFLAESSALLPRSSPNGQGGIIGNRLHTRAWRDDLRCGANYPLSTGEPSQCDPDGEYFCCSDWGYCGRTAAHCNCKYCVNYKRRVPQVVRLSGGSRPWEGNVLVDGRPVCDDSWGTAEGLVVCRQLRYHGLERITTNSNFGHVSSNYSMDDVECTGSEGRLWDCRHKTRDIVCGRSEAAGVICRTPDENRGSLVACANNWCRQHGTMDQFTRCGSVSQDGNTCRHPEIRYGTTEGGIPGSSSPDIGLSPDSLNAWCKQLLGHRAIGTQTLGMRHDCATPRGPVFWGEEEKHWVDGHDGSHPGSSCWAIQSLTCTRA